MKTEKKALITFLLVSALTVSGLFFKQTLSLLTLSDTLFLCALFFGMIGILLWIFSSGFFDTFQRSMRLALRRRNKNEPKEFLPLSEVGKGAFRYWLEVAAALLLVSLILLLLESAF